MAKGPEASTDFSTEYSPHLGQTLNIKISLSSEASALDGLLSHANRKFTPGLIIQAFHCLRHFDLKMQVRRDDERAENRQHTPPPEPPNPFWLVVCLRAHLSFQERYTESLCKRMSWIVAQ